MSHRHLEDDKKKKQRERNLRTWLIFQHSELLISKVSIGAPERAVMAAKSSKKEEKKIWTKQLTSVRNRIDNSKRLADDRFNRFAGTNDGGGRGR